MGSQDHERLNVGVLSLTAAGDPVTPARWFPDSDEPLPIGRRSQIWAMRLHPLGRKLYVLSRILSPTDSSAGPLRLLVFDVLSTGMLEFTTGLGLLPRTVQLSVMYDF